MGGFKPLYLHSQLITTQPGGSYFIYKPIEVYLNILDI